MDYRPRNRKQQKGPAEGNAFMPKPLEKRTSSRYGAAQGSPGPGFEQVLCFTLELTNPLPRNA